MNHDTVEKNIGLMGVLIALVISFGGLAEIVPLYFQGAGTQPAPGIKPYEALRLAGRVTSRETAPPRSRCARSLATSLSPSNLTSPEFGALLPPMSRSSVVFPQPEPPRIDVILPRGNWSETSLRIERLAS